MSNILTQSWLIERRHALRAMGSCISLPFLECMVPLRAAERRPDPTKVQFHQCATRRASGGRRSVAQPSKEGGRPVRHNAAGDFLATFG